AYALGGLSCAFTTVGSHGFLLSGGSYTTLDVPVPGASQTTAGGINPRGDIVGTYVDSSGHSHGFLLSGGSYTTLDVPGATFTVAVGVNPRGDIVGFYYDSHFQQHGFLRS